MFHTTQVWTPLTEALNEWFGKIEGKDEKELEKTAEKVIRKQLKKKKVDNTEFENMALKTYVNKWLNVSDVNMCGRLMQATSCDVQKSRFIPGILKSIITPERYMKPTYLQGPQGMQETSFGVTEEVQITEFVVSKVCPRLRFEILEDGIKRCQVDRLARFYFEIKVILRRFVCDPNQVTNSLPTAQGLYFLLCATETFILKELCEIHNRCSPEMALEKRAENCVYAEFLIAAWTLFHPLRKQMEKFRAPHLETSADIALVSAAPRRGTETYTFNDPSSDRVFITRTRTFTRPGGLAASRGFDDRTVEEIQAQSSD